MSGIIVKEGGIDCLPAIMPVMASAFDPRFGEAWTEAQCTGVLAMPGSALIFAGDGEAIGFALSRTIAGDCELMLLAVKPEHRGAGYGRKLLDAVVRNAQEHGGTSVFLEVREGNPAITLYSGAGFITVGRRRGYYRGADGQVFDALTYRLLLS